MGFFGVCFSDQPDAAAGGAAPIVGHYLHHVLYFSFINNYFLISNIDVPLGGAPISSDGSRGGASGSSDLKSWGS